MDEYYWAITKNSAVNFWKGNLSLKSARNGLFLLKNKQKNEFYHRFIFHIEQKIVEMIINCRNPEGGAPSAKRRAVPSHERRAICFFYAFSFFSARVVLVCPTTKKGSPFFWTSLFCWWRWSYIAETPKGAPSARRRASPSHERRAICFFSAFSFFSARVVLVCPT